MTYIGTGSLSIDASRILYNPNNSSKGALQLDGNVIYNPSSFNAGVGNNSDLPSTALNASYIQLELGRVQAHPSGTPGAVPFDHTLKLNSGLYDGQVVHFTVSQISTGSNTVEGIGTLNNSNTVIISGNFIGGEAVTTGGSNNGTHTNIRAAAFGCIWSATENHWAILYRSTAGTLNRDIGS